MLINEIKEKKNINIVEFYGPNGKYDGHRAGWYKRITPDAHENPIYMLVSHLGQAVLCVCGKYTHRMFEEASGEAMVWHGEFVRMESGTGLEILND